MFTAEWIFFATTLILGLYFAFLQRGLSLFETSKLILIGWGLGLAGLLPARGEHIYHFAEHWRAYPFIATVTATYGAVALKRNQFCARLSEGDLFLLTLSLVYLLSPCRWDHVAIGFLAFTPSLLIVLVIFGVISPSKRIRTALGAWALCLTGIFCLEQIVAGVREFAEYPTIARSDLWSLIDLGSIVVFSTAAFVYGTASLLPLTVLLRRKKASDDEYERSLQKDKVAFLRSRFITTKNPPKAILFITIIHGGPLLANWYFGFVSYPAALGYALALSPAITYNLAGRVFPPPEALPLDDQEREILRAG